VQCSAVTAFHARCICNSSEQGCIYSSNNLGGRAPGVDGPPWGAQRCHRERVEEREVEREACLQHQQYQQSGLQTTGDLAGQVQLAACGLCASYAPTPSTAWQMRHRLGHYAKSMAFTYQGGPHIYMCDTPKGGSKSWQQGRLCWPRKCSCRAGPSASEPSTGVQCNTAAFLGDISTRTHPSEGASVAGNRAGGRLAVCGRGQSDSQEHKCRRQFCRRCPHDCFCRPSDQEVQGETLLCCRRQTRHTACCQQGTAPQKRVLMQGIEACTSWEATSLC
jgi:hypothetical protein